MKFKLIALLPFFLVSTFCYSQKDFAAIILDDMVYLSASDASHTKLFTIESGWGPKISDAIYAPSEELFYGIYSYAAEPGLVSIDMDGKVTDIGRLKMTTKDSVYFLDGLAWDSVNCQIYGSISIDGAPATGDVNAESLVTINPDNARCTLLSTVTLGSSDADLDAIAFLKDSLVIADISQPSLNLYKIKTNQIPSSLNLNSYKWYSENTGSLGMSNIAVSKGEMYYPYSHKLYYIDMQKGTQLVGSTHNSSSGKTVTAIFQIHDYLLEKTLEDTVVCLSDTVTLAAIDPGVSGVEYKWSTGDTTKSIRLIAKDSGEVSVIVGHSGWCFDLHDTTNVTFKKCVSSTGPNLLDEESLNVYPNPAEDVLYISVSGTRIAEIKLFNATGYLNIVQLTQGKYEEKLNMSHLSPGVYFLTGRTESGVLFQRKVLKK